MSSFEKAGAIFATPLVAGMCAWLIYGYAEDRYQKGRDDQRRIDLILALPEPPAEIGLGQLAAVLHDAATADSEWINCGRTSFVLGHGRVREVQLGAMDTTRAYPLVP